METQDCDVLYQLASMGNEEALNELLKVFTSDADVVIKTILKQYKNCNLQLEEFREYISEIFVTAIITYNPQGARFKTYATFILDRRLRKQIMDAIDTHCKVLSLDENSEDDRPYMESIADPEAYSLSREVSLRNATLKISSPKLNVSKKETFRNKVNMLLYAGYTKEEVAKIMNVSVEHIRYIIRKNNIDEDLVNLKLELK